MGVQRTNISDPDMTPIYTGEIGWSLQEISQALWLVALLDPNLFEQDGPDAALIRKARRVHEVE
jgi:hypothetical protein